MSMPGSFNRDSSSEVEPDPIDRLMERFDDESEGSPVLLDDDDLDLGLEDEDDEEDDEAGRELEMEEIEEEDAGLPAEGQLQIAYDAASRQILLVGSDGSARRLTANHLRGSTLTLASIRSMLQARFGGGGRGDSDEDDDEDDDDEGGMYGWGNTRRNRKSYYDVVTEPMENGVKLLRSGNFGKPSTKLSNPKRKFDTTSTNLAASMRSREYDYRTPNSIYKSAIPNSAGVITAEFQSKVYAGGYSVDGSFFYCATQSFKVYLFDTSKEPGTGSKSVTDSAPLTTARQRMREQYWEHRTSLKTTKIFSANDLNCRWTITDANLSPDNEWLIYSSITPRVHLVKTHGDGDESDQSTLDFATGRGTRDFGIWSLRFANDAKEIVASGTDGQMAVYDVESRTTVLRVTAHTQDVNAVAFADKSSPHVLISGSDDSLVKIWDRRSLSGGRASGVCVGHTEGITFLSAKGDGRYVISNGKDQTARLWDLRTISDEEDERVRLDRRDYGIPGWDYRQSTYSKPSYLEHPHDKSVMKYRGHAVLRTLIRCNFSPTSTGQQYIYSGSSDGKIHIWNLDGTVAQTIDRRYSHPLINSSGEYNDPSSYTLRTSVNASKGMYTSTIRDVSWHPSEPSLMSTAWEGRGGVEGSLAKHEWSGIAGETLEDQAARQLAEAGDTGGE